LAGIVLLTACAGGDAGELASSRNATLIRNDPYPNVAAEVSHPSSQPRSSAEVRRIENRMMSLASEQGAAPRSDGTSPTLVEQMKELARRNQTLANDDPNAAVPVPRP
jgi:hypothetical protein